MMPLVKLGLGLIVDKFLNKSKAIRKRLPEKFKKPRFLIPAVFILVAAANAEEISELLPSEYKEVFVNGMEMLEGAVNMLITLVAI